MEYLEKALSYLVATIVIFICANTLPKIYKNKIIDWIVRVVFVLTTMFVVFYAAHNIKIF